MTDKTPPNVQAAIRAIQESISAVDCFELLVKKVNDLEAENDRLRRLLAESPADCPYCKLPADRMGECAYGFPGCARADDMCIAGGPTMTPEMEAALAESNARAAEEDGSFDEIEAAP